MSRVFGGADPEAAGFVLAGGLSRRMGRDKALAELGGLPLIEHALRILKREGLSAEIAGAQSALRQFAPVIEDEAAGLGPLGGVCAALAATEARYAVFVSVDMPLLPASLIGYLMRHARVTGAVVTVPSVNGYAQTFPAVVERSALPALEDSLRTGYGGCFAAFETAARSLGGELERLPVELLAQARHVEHPNGLPAAFWFLNVNDPAELERAESLLASFHRVS